jgi:hypothetical protein
MRWWWWWFQYLEKESKANIGYTPHSLVYVAGNVEVL